MAKKNPLKQARLDYILISNTFSDLVHSCNIQPGYRSDHSIVEMKITINKFVRGRGTWKFNSSLLKNPQYIQLINDAIDDEKLNIVYKITTAERLELFPIMKLIFQ